METGCIFCKIVSRELSATIVAESDTVLAFKNIAPAAPVHILIVPKVHITEFLKLGDDQTLVWNQMRAVAQRLILEFRLENQGHRLVINGGGANHIAHLHLHLLGPVRKEQHVI